MKEHFCVIETKEQDICVPLPVYFFDPIECFACAQLGLAVSLLCATRVIESSTTFLQMIFSYFLNRHRVPFDPSSSSLRR